MARIHSAIIPAATTVGVDGILADVHGSWNDPVCTRSCTRFNNTWVQWEPTDQVWRCCGDDICNGNPSNVTFKAVTPENWIAVPSAATTTSTSTTATRIPTGAAAAAGSNDNNNGTKDQKQDSGGLSTGAQAGIGVGLGIVGLAAIVGAGMWFLRKRRRSSAAHPNHDAEQMKQAPVHGGSQHAPAYEAPMQEHKQPNQQIRSELPSSGVHAPTELGSERAVAELPGDDGGR